MAIPLSHQLNLVYQPLFNNALEGNANNALVDTLMLSNNDCLIYIERIDTGIEQDSGWLVIDCKLALIFRGAGDVAFTQISAGA
jgi:hypothetical protein